MDLWGLYITALTVKVSGEKNTSQKKVAKFTDQEEFSHMFSESSAEEMSSDEDEAAAINTTSDERTYRSTAQTLRKYPPLPVSPLFSYLAILVLKLPITLNDIFSYSPSFSKLIIVGLNLSKYRTFKRTS
jgi:hypothetical protein